MPYQEDKDTLAEKVASGRVIAIEEERSGLPPGPLTDRDTFKRRLRRLAATVQVTRLVDEKTPTIAYDFHLDAPTPRIVKTMARQRGLWHGSDFQRGGGTNRSVAILNQTGTGGYSLQEYCLRLPQPNINDPSVKEIQQSVASFVREIVPLSGTAVWCRNARSSIFINTPEYYKQKIVHIGAEECSCHPDALLDFIAEFMPRYRDRFL